MAYLQSIESARRTAMREFLEGPYDWSKEPDLAELKAARGLVGQDDQAARERLERLADLGSVHAMLDLSDIAGGDARSISDQSEQWLKRAAATGSPDALHVYARKLHLAGRNDEALQMYRAAVLSGRSFSNKFLAGILLRGRPEPEQVREARHLLSRAGAEGDPAANLMLAIVLLRRDWYKPWSIVRALWLGLRAFRNLPVIDLEGRPSRRPFFSGFLLPVLAVCFVMFAAAYLLPGLIVGVAAWLRTENISWVATLGFAAALIAAWTLGRWLVGRVSRA